MFASHTVDDDSKFDFVFTFGITNMVYVHYKKRVQILTCPV